MGTWGEADERVRQVWKQEGSYLVIQVHDDVGWGQDQGVGW